MMPKRKRKRRTKPPSGSQSGGANISADKVDIQRDLVGRDKIEAGGHVFQLGSNVVFIQVMGASGIGDPISQTAFSIQQPSLQQKELEEWLESIRNKLGKAPSRLFEITSFEDEPPLPPKALAPRMSLVQVIASRISLTTWVSLIAATGLGKTQLARIIKINYGGGTSLWITISEQERQLALVHLRNQLVRAITTKPDFAERSADYHLSSLSDADLQRLAAQALGQNALVIIDNLPLLDAKNALLSFLCGFAIALNDYSSTLISTGQTSLPVFVSERLSDKFSEIVVPPFDQIDISFLLDVLGAPDHIKNEEIITLILASTSGHPTLVSATLNWLQNLQWKFDVEVFDKLLTGDPTKAVREETVRLLPRFIQDEQTRQFLYRLSLLFHPFDEKLTQAVAEVEPYIVLPGEKLIELHGPWLSRTPRNTYEVSPLVRESGRSNLTRQQIKDIHAAVADELLSRSPIPIDQVHNIAIHLFASDQGDRLAIFIIQALVGVETKPQADYLDWVAALFLDDAPKQIEISPHWMIMVRAIQVRLRLINGGEFTKLLKDLDARIEELDLTNDGDALAALFAYANTGVFLDDAPAIMSALQAVRFSRLLRAHPKLATSLSFPSSPQQVVWFPLMRMREVEEYRDILQVIQAFEHDELSALLSNTRVEETVYLWVDGLWHIAAGQAADRAAWDDVLGILDQIEQIGLLSNESALVVAARRARAIVYADYLKQVDDALQVIRMSPPPRTPTEVFILSYTAASILVDAAHLDEASNEYRHVLAADTGAFEYYRFDALRRMAEISGRKSDWVASASWCAKAIHFAHEHEIIPTEDEIELLAELAWVRWCEGKRKRAAGAMYSVSIRLAQMDTLSNPRHKEVLLKVGHVLGWMAYIASGGTSPELTIEGEPYIPPFPGMVSRRREQLAQLDRPGVGYLFMQLGLLSTNVDVYRIAFNAYKLAHQWAVAQKLQLMSASIDFLRAGIVSMYLPPVEALDIASSGVVSFGVSQTLEPKGKELTTFKDDIQQVWLKLSREQRHTAERLLFRLALGPAVCYLLEKNVPNEMALETLNKWRLALDRLSLEDRNHWAQLIGAADLIFKPVTGNAGVKTKLGEILPDDTDIKLILYLALSPQLDTPLNEIANSQAIVYQFVLNRKGGYGMMRKGVGALIVRTWRHIAEKRGFYLSNPMRLRKLLSETHSQPTETEVAQVLLAAANSVGIQYDEEVYQTLSKLVSARGK